MSLEAQIKELPAEELNRRIRGNSDTFRIPSSLRRRAKKDERLEKSGAINVKGIRNESKRKEEAIRLGLSPDSSWQDIVALKNEAKRLYEATRLGLDPKASWKVIYRTKFMASKDRKLDEEVHRCGLPDGSSWPDVFHARASSALLHPDESSHFKCSDPLNG